MSNDLQNIRWNAPIGGPRFQAPVKAGSNSVPPAQRLADGVAFQKLLDQQLATQASNHTLTFSKHATLRMQQRGMHLDATQMQQFNQAIDKAAAKGARDALVLMQDQAYIVNVKQKTVITAMDANELSDHVVTQIDSAVIVPATQK